MKSFIPYLIKKVPPRLLFTFALLLISTLAVLLIRKINNMNLSAHEVNHTNEVRLALSETFSMLRDAEADQRGFLLSKDSTFLNNCNLRQECLTKHLDTLQHLVSDNPAQLKQLDTLRMQINNRLQLLGDIIAKYGKETAPFIDSDIKIELLSGKQAMEAVKNRLQVMENIEEQLLKIRTNTSNRYKEATPLYALYLTLAAITISLLAFIKLEKQLRLSKQRGEQAGKEAKKTGSLLESAEHIANMAAWEWNLTTNHIERSGNLYQLFGYEEDSKEAATGNFLHLIDEEDRNRLLLQIDNAHAQQQLTFTSHFWATHKNGERRFFKCITSFSKNEKGEEILTGITQDTTEEHLLRREARKRAYLTDQVVEHNIDMIMVVDTETRITLWNKTFEEVFGLSKNEVLGKKLTEVFPYLEGDVKLTLTKAALEGKETIKKQVHFLKNEKIGEASYIPLRNSHGLVEGVLILTHDITDLKQASERLQESNLRFEQAEQAGNLGSYRRNTATGEIKASDNLYSVFGFEPGSITPTFDLFRQLLHPDDIQKIGEALQRKESGILAPVRFRILRQDGIRYLKASAIALPNESGETVVYGSIQDVTDEELLQQQLEQRTSLMESIIENSDNLISVLDTDMRYTIWNRSIEKALKLPKEEVIGKKLLEVFPKMEKLPNFRHVVEGLEGKASYRVEYTDVMAGITTETSHIPLKNKEDNITGLLIVSYDITERKRAARSLEKVNTELQLRNKALQEAYAFNQHITDLAPNGIYVYDQEKGKSLFTNKKLVDLHGYNEKELNDLGPNMLSTIVHPDDLHHLYKNLERFKTATDEDVIELEYRMRSKSGEYRNLICRESVFKRNEKGEPIQFIGVAIDVTDLKNAEKELKEKNRQLQQSNEELTSFSSVASHDLQEPLRKIQTFANYLEETETGLSEGGRNSLQRMQKAAARMRELINDLLAFSRIEMEGEEKEQVDLNEVLELAKSTLVNAIREKGATIIDCKLPTVQGVCFKLQQLFVNLLGNAIKYSTPGLPPVIQITCNQVVTGKDDNLRSGAMYYHICFKDNGIGFEQQYAGKIFEMFQRLHTQNDYPGTGIGLAICKKIVQNYGGQILASSNPGEGALFEIFLPVPEATETVAG